MRRLIAQIFLAALLASPGSVTPSVGRTGQSPSRVTLVDFSFIMGSWRADWNGGTGEEHWSTPSGDSMMGTFRFVKDGKGRFYELMLIEQTSDGPVLRLKHFNAGLIGGEDKAQVYSFHLVDYGKSFAVFELENKSSRLTYRALPEHGLSVLLEHPTEGKQKAEEFKFNRADLSPHCRGRRCTQHLDNEVTDTVDVDIDNGNTLSCKHMKKGPRVVDREGGARKSLRQGQMTLSMRNIFVR